MSDTILITTDDGVHAVTLNRPDRRNAMNVAMVDALIAALDAAEASSARLIVLRGSGGHFCAGGDIADMAAARTTPTNGQPDGIVALSARFGHLALRFARTPIPVLAVVEGAVMGGGFGVACTADVVLASATATFRLPETSLGVVPAQIAPFLIERLGYSEAKRLALTGAKLDARAALGVGLVHEVAPADELDDRIAAATAQLLKGGPQATRATKELFGRLHPGIRPEDIDHAAQVFATAARSEEAMEGMTAFLSKQRPSWAP
ncbi:MAG: enoyl-CoA hydratase/isomerase family protein [Myxococcales bacterium]|nr:enoyl-CoA hydratase/isomerase family protein [Myxococcales bacterium]